MYYCEIPNKIQENAILIADEELKIKIIIKFN